jgi:hypothetical protein
MAKVGLLRFKSLNRKNRKIKIANFYEKHMKILHLIGLAGILVGQMGSLEAYDWTIHNATNSPIDVKVRLLSCLAHDPKQTIAPGDKYKFHVGGWSIGCCLKDDGLEVNGETLKHIDYQNFLDHDEAVASIIDAIIAGAITVGGTAFAGGAGLLGAAIVGSLVATGFSWIESKIKWTCGDSDFVITEDSNGEFIAVQKSNHHKSSKS